MRVIVIGENRLDKYFIQTLDNVKIHISMTIEELNEMDKQKLRVLENKVVNELQIFREKLEISF